MYFVIYYVLLLSLGVRAVESCTLTYNDMSCTYTETCDVPVERYEVWRTFVFLSSYNSGNENCISPIYFNGNHLYPVYLVLNGQDYFIDDINTPIPAANYFEGNELTMVYGLDLSNNGYSQTPNIRSMENLVQLNMSNNFLTSAMLSNTYELYVLHEIDLSYNMINHIEVNSRTYPYRTLLSINLSHNDLQNLPDGIFDKLENLQKLDLSFNHIDKLTLTTFENIKQIIDLNLSNNRLIGINASLFRFKQLKILNLSGNKIKNLSSIDFEQLRTLETLDLSSNMITYLDVDLFNTLESLENLYWNNNQLQTLDKNVFSRLSSLISIDLSKNGLESLPKGLFKNTEVVSFSIEDNKLEGPLDRGMFEGFNVSKLDLSSHFFTEIKDNAFYELIWLDTLLLNSNNIQTLSNMCFKTLIYLKQLDLSNNQIINIDFNKEDLGNLHTLLLKNNRLTKIKSDCLKELSSLQFLDLTDNQIIHFETKSFKSLRHLIYLGISNNSLAGTIERNTFEGLILLPMLDISRSVLTTIQNASFNNMSALKELNISRCNISELQYNTFVNTEYIETLDLSYNKLELFLVNTTDLNRVTTLLLNNNFIKTISSHSLHGLFQLIKIVLSHNVIENIHNESFNSLYNLGYLDLSDNEKLNMSLTLVSKCKHLSTLMLSGVDILTNVSFIMEGNQLLDLQLSNTGVKNIHELNLGKMAHLIFLNLNYNNVSKLQHGDFDGISALSNLDLSFNQITSIQPGVFKDNAVLLTLNISHNFLSTIGYGVFRGLIHLTVLDISFNNIKDVQAENFYEVESLSQLVLDHNKIDTLNAEEFVGTRLAKLSIGNNPLPCRILVKLKKKISFEITAIRTDEHNNDNVNGITCNKDRILEPIVGSDKEIQSYDVLNGLKHVLYELTDRYTQREDIDSTYLEKISNIIEKLNSAYNENLFNLANLTSKVITVNNNTNIMFHQNNIMLNKIINLLNQTVSTPVRQLMPVTDFSSRKPIVENESDVNSTIDIILYINKIKKELENALAIETQNINRIENKLYANSSQTESSPTHIGRQDLLPNNETSKLIQLYITEICVLLILLILVGFILYKLYKSKMLRRNGFSISSHELPTAMENSAL